MSLGNARVTLMSFLMDKDGAVFSGHLGVDVSHHNDWKALPWAEWVAGGLEVAVARASIGYQMDSAWPHHIERAAAAGVATRGAYHFLLHSEPDGPGHTFFYDPVQECQNFLKLRVPGLAFCMLDVEAEGITGADVEQWCAHYDAHCDLPLVLYGNMDLEHVCGAGNPKLARYGLLVSDYGFFAPGTSALPLRSTPPADPRLPRVPKVGRKIGWQFAGDNGRKAPYTGRIDLSLWDELPGQGADAAAPAREALALVHQALELLA